MAGFLAVAGLAPLEGPTREAAVREAVVLVPARGVAATRLLIFSSSSIFMLSLYFFWFVFTDVCREEECARVSKKVHVFLFRLMLSVSLLVHLFGKSVSGLLKSLVMAKVVMGDTVVWKYLFV